VNLILLVKMIHKKIKVHYRLIQESILHKWIDSQRVDFANLCSSPTSDTATMVERFEWSLLCRFSPVLLEMGHILLLYHQDDQIIQENSLFSYGTGHQILYYDQNHDDEPSPEIMKCVMIGIPIEMPRDVCPILFLFSSVLI
jgi:hypothetical protein